MYANIDKLFFRNKYLNIKKIVPDLVEWYIDEEEVKYIAIVKMAGLLGAVAGARELLLGDGSPTIDNWTFRFNVVVLP